MLQKLSQRRKELGFRELDLVPAGAVDLCSNDYLGLLRSGQLSTPAGLRHGSSGSRLLTGNHALAMELEQELALFHQSPSAVLFNSGYDANLGLLGSMAEEGDTILYDFLCHASIRDGIRLSRASSFSFRHNDIGHLEARLQETRGQVYVVTETVFSMDGDLCPLREMVELAERYGAQVIVDEAHATGVIGPRGEGLVQMLGLQERIMARIHTFGKAVGAHGAVILGSENLKHFLLNFSRPLIYSTALPEAALAAVSEAYKVFPHMQAEREQLQRLITSFHRMDIAFEKLPSPTAIQAIMVPGNAEVTALSAKLLEQGIYCRPIRYPTVPKGTERLRVILHAFNTEEEMRRLQLVVSRSVNS
jgi:8-amino-7-oxononanoate synthase